jgi:predicted small secreted protein
LETLPEIKLASWRFIMKKLVLLLVVALLIALEGCATFRGMGEDFQNLGRGLEKTFDKGDT